MTRLNTLFASALVAGFALAPVAQAADGQSPWSVRLRATYLDAVDQTVKVEDKLIPEFDIDYAINDTWSLELVLTKQKQ